MRLHYLQHVPFEGLGHIASWAQKHNIQTSKTRLFASESPPPLDQFDLLIIMGGSMEIKDEDQFPWLVAEKAFIRQAIDAGKMVLGICLGAQLIASQLGACVYPGEQKEIGWLPIQRPPEAPNLIPKTLTVFHWHGDTFDLPNGATRLASSALTPNQGFIYKRHVIGLQFHIETTPESRAALIKNCSHELVDAPYIQTAQHITETNQYFGSIHSVLEKILDRWLIELGAS